MDGVASLYVKSIVDVSVNIPPTASCASSSVYCVISPTYSMFPSVTAVSNCAFVPVIPTIDV